MNLTGHWNVSHRQLWPGNERLFAQVVFKTV